MDEVKYLFRYWNLPQFHSRMVKKIADEALMEVSQDESIDKFEYNNGDFRDLKFCDALAKLLSDEYQDDVKSSSLFVTYGATFGFAYLLDSFFYDGDTVIFEEITYGTAKQHAVNRHLDIKTVPFDGENISLSHLEEIMKNTKVKENTARHPYNGLVYLLPILHNPRGTSYTEECSKSVVKLARKYNFLVVTDDVYNFYQFKEKKHNRIYYYDKIMDGGTNPLGNVVSNGTLSKILFPSIRLGWIEGREALIKHFSNCPRLSSGGGFNTFNQLIAEKMLNNKGLKTYLTELKEIYKNLLFESCDYLKNNLPSGVKFRQPDGSSFVWIELPKHCRAEDVQEECLRRDTIIATGNEYGGEKYSNFFRIPVTNEHRQEAFSRICEAVKCVVEKSTSD